MRHQNRKEEEKEETESQGFKSSRIRKRVESSSQFNPITLRDCQFLFLVPSSLNRTKPHRFSGNKELTRMVPANLVFLLALSPLVFDLHFSSSTQISKNDALPSQSACVNCTICPYPCHTLPPSPPFGYPLYGAPPPQASSYPSYGAPPPPQVQSNCSTVPVECCHNVPPPNTYTYLPNENFSPFSYSTISFISFLMLVTSFAVLF